jgi:protoheme ferro-lyase
MRLERPPALNDDAVFVAALAALVRERAAAWIPNVAVA